MPTQAQRDLYRHCRDRFERIVLDNIDALEMVDLDKIEATHLVIGQLLTLAATLHILIHKEPKALVAFLSRAKRMMAEVQEEHDRQVSQRPIAL